jgi:hypothetical protein
MKSYLAATAIGTALVTTGGAAGAQSIIREPGAHVTKVEFELHGSLGWWGRYYNDWLIGPGFRVGIPIVRNGFIPRINNSVAINFGLDLYWWPGWNYYGTAVAIDSPVMMQWNFYLTPKWSVFGEAGVALEFYPTNGPNCYDYGHGGCDHFWLWPGFSAGARFHPGGGTGFPTLTMRLGFPAGFTIGVSF